MMIVSPPDKQAANSVATYSRKRDVVYRFGMVLQVLGAAVLAVLYPLGSPFYSAGIMLFELGALLSGICLLVWMFWIKKLILGSILFGLSLQVFGMYAASPEHAMSLIMAGLGFVCVGVAGMVGKEAYCFGYREGWVLMWLYPLLILFTSIGHEQKAVNSLFFSAHFLLYLSLVGKKLTQPFLAVFPSSSCRMQDEGNK